MKCDIAEHADQIALVVMCVTNHYWM